jgi:hypothetical protein
MLHKESKPMEARREVWRFMGGEERGPGTAGKIKKPKQFTNLSADPPSMESRHHGFDQSKYRSEVR